MGGHLTPFLQNGLSVAFIIGWRLKFLDPRVQFTGQQDACLGVWHACDWAGSTSGRSGRVVSLGSVTGRHPCLPCSKVSLVLFQSWISTWPISGAGASLCPSFQVTATAARRRRAGPGEGRAPVLARRLAGSARPPGTSRTRMRTVRGVAGPPGEVQAPKVSFLHASALFQKIYLYWFQLYKRT